MLLIKLGGGLALITFGVRFLRKGLDRLFGGQLIVWLSKTAKSRPRAMLAGVVTGALAPSSTGLALLTAQILGDGMISTEKMLAILLGANIGMTLLANLAAFQIGDYAGLLLFFGVLGFQFLRREMARGIGQCLLALGFIFLAMNFLSEGASAFSASHDVGEVFGVLDRHPYLLGLSAAALAVLLQSSTATIGLGIGLANGGALPGSLFAIWIIGTNIGLGITSSIVSWSSLEGRRLGAANLLAKIAVALLVILLNPLKFISSSALGLPESHQLALMHTGFNVLVALLSWPLLNLLLTAAKTVFVPEPVEGADRQAVRKSFLDPQALDTPSIALAHATREVLRMTDEVKAMLQNLWSAHAQRNLRLVESVPAQDDAIDEMNQQLALYLSQVVEGMSDFDRQRHIALLSYANELESAGDIIEKNLSSAMQKQLTEGWTIDPNDEAALDELYRKIIRQFDVVACLITARDHSTALKIINEKETISAWCLAQKRAHYLRLKPGDQQGLQVSLCFLDIMDGLRRIGSHLAAAAYGFSAGARGKRAKGKAPRREQASLTSPAQAPAASERAQLRPGDSGSAPFP